MARVLVGSVGRRTFFAGVIVAVACTVVGCTSTTASAPNSTGPAQPRSQVSGAPSQPSTPAAQGGSATTLTAHRLSSPGGPLETVPVEVNGTKFAFIVDSGATTTTLDTAAAKSAGLHPMPLPSPVTTRTLGRTTPVQATEVPPWAVGSHKLPPSKLLTKDLGFPAAPVGGLKLGGLLGADVQYLDDRLTVDYLHNRVTLGGPAASGGKTVSIHVLHANGQVAVTASVHIGAHSFVAAIDTGAARSAVSTQVATAAGLRRQGHRMQINAAGCAATVQPVRFAGARLGSVRVPTITADSSARGSALGPKIDATVGSDVLSHYGSITIDYRNSTLTLGA